MRILLFILCIFPIISFAHHYTTDQINLLKTGYEIGSEIGWPETIQAILLQETRAGQYGYGVGDGNLPVGKRSYGTGQVKEATARFVLNNYPDIKDQYFGTRKLHNIYSEEIIVLLMTNNEANVLIATKNFELMLKFSGGDWAKAVVAYNQGWGVARILEHPREHPYFKHILHLIKNEVRPFNKNLLIAEN